MDQKKRPDLDPGVKEAKRNEDPGQNQHCAAGEPADMLAG
jgi:hypothetical protein